MRRKKEKNASAGNVEKKKLEEEKKIKIKLKKNMEPWLHVVLDLDGTLVDEDSGGSAGPFFRPHVAELFHALFSVCKSVSLWTAASSEWLEEVRRAMHTNQLLPPGATFLHTWHGARCSRTINRRAIEDGEFYSTPLSIKRLRKMWAVAAYNVGGTLTRDTVLILDNTPTTYLENFGNAVPVPTWRASQEQDQALLRLADWIAHMSEHHRHGTVRHTNKRLWWCTSPSVGKE